MRPRGIGRRQFLKAAAVFWGFLGGGMSGITGAMEPERKGGDFDNPLPPAMRIRSGDTVLIETGAHLAGGVVLGARTEDWIRKYKEGLAGRPDVHFYPGPQMGAGKRGMRAARSHLAGPIHVEGAAPGDVLRIEILEIVPAPYGFNVRPGPPVERNGSASDHFTMEPAQWYRTDPGKFEFGFAPDAKIPLRLFPDILGVQLPESGRRHDNAPGKHAGNLACRELVAGTSLYVPVQVRGAGVVTGNARMVRDDGEPDDCALERAFRSITLRMTVRDELKGKVDGPFISTPTHWIAPGFHADPREARTMAVREALRFLNALCGMSGDEGRAFCRKSVVFRAAGSPGFIRGVHAMIPKSLFPAVLGNSLPL